MMQIGQHAKNITKVAKFRAGEKDPLKRSHLLAALNFLGELNFEAANHHVIAAGYELSE